jgi:hypothetical protein
VQIAAKTFFSNTLSTGCQLSMKNQMNTSRIFRRASFALAFVLTIWSPVQILSAAPDGDKKMTEGKMMECCKEMKEQKQLMLADMKAQDTEIAVQVATMNSAPEDKKVGLIAAVVTKMTEQRAAMTVRMEKMQGNMVKHMMQHMQMGKDSMSQCPMMKDMDGKSGDAKKEQK